MKKILSMTTLSVFIALFLVGCGNDQEAVTNEQNNPTQDQTQVEVPETQETEAEDINTMPEETEETKNEEELSETDSTQIKQTETVSQPQNKTPQPTVTKESSCEYNDGRWLTDYQECERIDEEWCNRWGGEYDECGSVCRHDPEAKFCTRQCMPYCGF